MSDNTMAVYMVASIRGALYTGFTNELATRIDQHKSGTGGGFSSKYRTTKLVWCEVHTSVETARLREAQIKKWRRSKKAYLIELENPYWVDISETVG
jgi:putative endonuclease